MGIDVSDLPYPVIRFLAERADSDPHDLVRYLRWEAEVRTHAATRLLISPGLPLEEQITYAIELLALASSLLNASQRVERRVAA